MVKREAVDWHIPLTHCDFVPERVEVSCTIVYDRDDEGGLEGREREIGRGVYKDLFLKSRHYLQSSFFGHQFCWQPLGKSDC